MPFNSLLSSISPYSSNESTKKLLTDWCDKPWDNELDKFAWVIALAEKNEAIGIFLVELDDIHTVQIHYGISKSSLYTTKKHRPYSLRHRHREATKCLAVAIHLNPAIHCGTLFHHCTFLDLNKNIQKRHHQIYLKARL